MWILLVSCAFAIVTAAASQEGGSASPEQPGAAVVRQASELYEVGRLSEAEHLALKTLDLPGQLSRMEQSELYRILAFCSIANDDEENARRHFVSALRLNPNLSADPISWSPKVRRVFERAREEFAQIVQAEAQKRVSMEAELCRQASLRSLFLPGGGQALKGQRARGWITGAMFWGSLATFIYAEALLPGARDKYHRATDPAASVRRYNDYRDLSRLTVLSGGLTIGVYGFSFFDALWRRPSPEKSRQTP